MAVLSGESGGAGDGQLHHQGEGDQFSGRRRSLADRSALPEQSGKLEATAKGLAAFQPEDGELSLPTYSNCEAAAPDVIINRRGGARTAGSGIPAVPPSGLMYRRPSLLASSVSC